MAKDAKTPAPSRGESRQPRPSSAASEIAAFVEKARALGATAERSGERGRLIFALDATMSRQPTWDTACMLQADMFEEAARIGGLDVQLIYFRGFRECRASRWVSDARALRDLMVRIDCRGGHTQIRKVLAHARKEAGKKPVQALVYVGDCMEENVDDLCAIAGELGLIRLPVFLFQEGHEPMAANAFREIARLSGGAYCPFDPSAAGQLRELLRAVAAYAAGGRRALEAHGGAGGRRLLEQLK